MGGGASPVWVPQVVQEWVFRSKQLDIAIKNLAFRLEYINIYNLY